MSGNSYGPLRRLVRRNLGCGEDHALEAGRAVQQFRIGVATAAAHAFQLKAGRFGQLPRLADRVLQEQATASGGIGNAGEVGVVHVGLEVS